MTNVPGAGSDLGDLRGLLADGVAVPERSVVTIDDGRSHELVCLAASVGGRDRLGRGAVRHVVDHDVSAEVERAGFTDIPEFPLTSFYNRNMIAQVRRDGLHRGGKCERHVGQRAVAARQLAGGEGAAFEVGAGQAGRRGGAADAAVEGPRSAVDGERECVDIGVVDDAAASVRSPVSPEGDGEKEEKISKRRGDY